MLRENWLWFQAHFNLLLTCAGDRGLLWGRRCHRWRHRMLLLWHPGAVDGSWRGVAGALGSRGCTYQSTYLGICMCVYTCTEAGVLSLWRSFRHWLPWWLTFWQLQVQGGGDFVEMMTFLFRCMCWTAEWNISIHAIANVINVPWELKPTYFNEPADASVQCRVRIQHVASLCIIT